MFIPGNDQQAALPKRGTADSLISRFYQGFATIYIGQRMLRSAILVVISYIVARFDENVAKWIGGLLEVTSELAVVANIGEMNALQRGNHREVIATVKQTCNTFFMQRVEDGAVPKRKSSKSLPVCNFPNAGAVIESSRRRGVDEHAVRPSWPRHGG